MDYLQGAPGLALDGLPLIKESAEDDIFMPPDVAHAALTSCVQCGYQMMLDDTWCLQCGWHINLGAYYNIGVCIRLPRTAPRL